MKKGYASTPLEHRYEKFVVRKGDGCWGWSGAKSPFGYGLINSGGHNGRALRAHRLSYEMHNGPIPKGLFVCHRCDVPECTNPAHLFVGTPRENARDCSNKGRARGGQKPGITHAQAKLTDKDMAEIKRAYQPGKVSLKAVAERFNVSLQTIWRVVNGHHRPIGV